MGIAPKIQNLRLRRGPPGLVAKIDVEIGPITLADLRLYRSRPDARIDVKIPKHEATGRLVAVIEADAFDAIREAAIATYIAATGAVPSPAKRDYSYRHEARADVDDVE